MMGQIERFAASLQTLASDYSDPAVILQHVPVLRDHADKVQIIIDNKEFVLAGLIALFVLNRLRKRKNKQEKPTSMVMPPPYYGEDSTLDAEHPLNADGAAGEDPSPRRKLRKSKTVDEAETSPLDAIAAMVSPRKTDNVAKTPEKRTTEQQLEDISKAPLVTRPVLSADEARMRAMLQASLNELNVPYLIMARTSLSTLLEPAQTCAGQERAHALAALGGKALDFGLFDRAGRLALAIDVLGARAANPAQTSDKEVVAIALLQAGINTVQLDTKDDPKDVTAKIAPFVTANETQMSNTPLTSPYGARAERRKRPARTERPTRPGRPSAVPAE